MSQEPVVQLLDVSKVFYDLWGHPRVAAVDALSLEVAPGEVLGLLGPNGAGKSTTIKLLLGLLFPTRGKLAVFGREPRDLDVRRRTGYLPEETRLHKFLTAAETLDFFGQLLGLDRTERRRRTGALLEMVGLGNAADRTVGEMSKGMARRIGLAVALVGDPELVVLDEPTSGLDPIGTREVKDLVIELARRGKTILLSSHLLSDVEDACHRIAILYGGKLRALGRTDELLARDERIRIELDRPAPEQVAALEAAARAAAGDRPVTIGSPRDRLEAFFLRVVGAARAERLDTGGAREGAGVAGFLGHGAGPSPRPVSQEVHAVGKEAHAVGQEVHAVSQEVHAVGKEAHAVGQEVHAVSQEVHAVGKEAHAVGKEAHAVGKPTVPSPQLSPPPQEREQAPPQTAKPSQPSHAGGVALEHVESQSVKPAAPALPVENPKTRAVLDRLLQPRESGP